jgi:regulation of enolase protein 1 (concanavalin A-like superfamily)
MEWYNEPDAWKAVGDTIEVTAAGKTDFWRRTHSGAIRDNGHFYYARQSGDFTCEVRLSGKYAAQFDQAGLMVRADEANWLKCGIELVDGVQNVSAVLTREFSDWSIVPAPQRLASIWLRATVHGSTIEVHYSLDGSRYTLLRLGYLPRAETISAGIMCASPQGNGFPASFTGFVIRPA